MADHSEQDNIMENAISSANTHAALVDLTEQTGGFLITDSSKRMLSRIMNDAESRYELTYSPAWEIYDGRFHKIERALATMPCRGRPMAAPSPRRSCLASASSTPRPCRASSIIAPRRSTSDRRRVPPSSRSPWRSPWPTWRPLRNRRKRSSGCMPRC